jgi:alpha-1,3/alpha-1,6-mannosyltransferase
VGDAAAEPHSRKAAPRAAEDRALLARVHLVLAGGYDPRLEENVSYCAELAALAQARGLSEHVSFVRSFSDDQRLLLVQSARAVVYTPDREHFGIVPIEAMYAARPVVAVASGGPLESVSHGETGWLVPQEPASFARALLRLVRDATLAAKMGQAGKRAVAERFSLDAFGAGLDAIVTEQLEHASSRRAAPRLSRLAVLALLLALLAAVIVFATRAAIRHLL